MSKNIADILPSAEGADRSPKGRARRIFDGLRRDWESVAWYKGVASSPYWREDGLFLGAGTRLAERIQGNEARIIALLAAGFRKYLSIAVLGPLVASERAWRAGRAAEASAHIQRLNMPPLAGRDAAYRLQFVLDGIYLYCYLLAREGRDVAEKLLSALPDDFMYIQPRGNRTSKAQLLSMIDTRAGR